jgi:hypothetical protein
MVVCCCDERSSEFDGVGEVERIGRLAEDLV